MRKSRSLTSREVAALMARKIGVDRAVAGEVAADALPRGREDRDRGVRRAARGGLDVEPLERVGAGVGPELVGDERLEVQRRDLLLLVRDLLEALERLVERLAGDLVAEVHQRGLQRVAAGVLAEHDRVRVVDADRRGGHDLVGRALLEHAVLVDAGLVLERVAAHDGLVGLHGVAGQAGDQPRGLGDLARVDLRREADVLLARLEQHHDLLQRRVARALAEAVDRALHLARARLQAGERVRHGQTEVVVAVDGQHDVA